jgi:hypothetical protein
MTSAAPSNARKKLLQLFRPHHPDSPQRTAAYLAQRSSRRPPSAGQKRPRHYPERRERRRANPVAESSHITVGAIKADGKPGKITLHEIVEKTPVHRTTFDLANIRTIEPSDPGSLIRHGIDGSGRFEALAVGQDCRRRAPLFIDLDRASHGRKPWI